MNEKNNPQHLDCGRSIPATHGGWNDSRLDHIKVWWILIINLHLSTQTADESAKWFSWLPNASLGVIVLQKMIFYKLYPPQPNEI